MWLHAFWAMQCAGHILEADAKLPQQIEPHLLPHLLGWHSHILMDGRRTSPPVAGGLWLNIIWNLSCQYVVFSKRRSHIWHIESPRKMCNPVIQTWGQSQNVHCLKCTWRCIPSSASWAITYGLLRALHILHNHYMNTWQVKGVAGSQRASHYWRAPWKPLKH